MKKLISSMIILPAMIFCQNVTAQSVEGEENPGKTEDIESYANSDSAKAFLDSAQHLMQLGKMDEALNLCKKATEIQPENNDEAYIAWFRLCIGTEKTDEAMQVIDAWIEHNPENTQAWLYKGFAEAHLNHPEKALEAFDMLIKLQPEEGSNYVGRGQMLYALERYEEAIEAFDRSASMDSSRTDVMGMKTAALAKLGRFDEALVLINKTLEQNPDDISGIYNRACLYSIKGDKVNALADLRRAIEIEPSMKEYARNDEDFKSLYENEDFIKLTK